MLYGFEVTVDDLPRGYGVTHMNRGTATTDSDLNEDTKLIEPGDPRAASSYWPSLPTVAIWWATAPPTSWGRMAPCG